MKALVDCPYCEAEVKISSEDWPIADGQESSFTCPKCEMNFMFLLEISYTLTPKKAACLNGEEHVYKGIPFETDCNFTGDDGVHYTKFREHTYSVCGFAKKEFF
jgi:hypothetical protein